MQPVDWHERVDLQRRERPLPDDTAKVVPLATGTLADMIKYVFLLPADDRARLWVDGQSIGLLSIFEIIALSMRPDFPA